MTIKNYISILLLVLISVCSSSTYAQVIEPVSETDEDQLGAWYMYFWSADLKESKWGFQGDLQYRNWDLGGDLEQLLLRGGLTYSPEKSKSKFTLGYAHITTGEFGSSTKTTKESRIYQEALFPQKIGTRIYLLHRLRFEQRFVEDQDFRMRGRYNLFVNIPLNGDEIIEKTIYLAFYNELFLNANKDIGNDRTVEVFDRDRIYGAIGYGLTKTIKLQLGYMQQITNDLSKGQIQLSVHHKF